MITCSQKTSSLLKPALDWPGVDSLVDTDIHSFQYATNQAQIWFCLYHLFSSFFHSLLQTLFIEQTG